jgi:hypothetical protein
MANKTIEALILCPFYKSESAKSITCEGIIGCDCVNRFDTISQKIAHETKYCAKDYDKCRLHTSVLRKY